MHRCIPFSALACAFLMLLSLGCAGDSARLNGSVSGQSGHAAVPTAPPARLSIPSPLQLHRTSATLANYRHAGAEYDSGLADNVIPGANQSLIFNPDIKGQVTPEDNLAWAIYSFDSTDFIRQQDVRFKASSPLNESEVFIGLANWATGRWDWRQPTALGRLAFNFDDYRDPNNFITVALVVVGSTPLVVEEVKLSGVGDWQHSYGGPDFEFTQFMETVTAAEAKLYLGAVSASFNAGQRSALALKIDDDGHLDFARLAYVPGEYLDPRAWDLSFGQNLIGVAEFRRPNALTPEVDDQVPVLFNITEDGNLAWAKVIDLIDFNYAQSVIASDRIVLSFTLDGAANGFTDDDGVILTLDMNGAVVGCKRIDSGDDDNGPKLIEDRAHGKIYAQLRAIDNFNLMSSRAEVMPDGSLGTQEAVPVGDSMSVDSDQAVSDTPNTVLVDGDPGAIWLNTDGSVKWATELNLGFEGNGWFARIAGPDKRMFLGGRSTTIAGESGLLAIMSNTGELLKCQVWSDGGECYNVDLDGYGSIYAVIDGADDAHGSWVDHEVTSNDYTPLFQLAAPLTLTITDFAPTVSDFPALQVDTAPALTIDTGGGGGDILVVKTDVLNQQISE